MPPIFINTPNFGDTNYPQEHPMAMIKEPTSIMSATQKKRTLHSNGVED